MKDNKGIFIGVAIVVVLAIAGGVALMSNSDSKDSNSSYSNDKMNMDTSKKTDTTKSTDTQAADTSKAVEATSVTIQNYAFDAPVIKVKVGTAVTWTNKDGVKHNVNPDSPSADFPVGKLIGNGETYSFTFTKAGTYSYHCMPHPYMKGTVVVTQ